VKDDVRARVDGLTGAGSIDGFRSEAARLPPGFTAVMFDVDLMNPFNDTFGHIEGDRALVRVAQALAAAVDPRALFRVGGDEFAVFVELTDWRTVARRAQAGVDGLRLPFRHAEVRLKHADHLTVSVGAVTCREGEDGRALLERLRDAVGHAKLGRPGGIHG